MFFFQFYKFEAYILTGKTIEEAGKTPEETGEGDKAEGGDKLPEEKPAKKRKWGSRSASTAQKAKKVSSMPISTDSLKVWFMSVSVLFVQQCCMWHWGILDSACLSVDAILSTLHFQIP